MLDRTKIQLNIEYDLKAGEAVGSHVNRQITEQLIFGAAQLMYPNGMVRAESQIFSEIQAGLNAGTMDIELSSHAIEFLYDLFLSEEASKRVRFKPEVALWFCKWVGYLEALKIQNDAK